MVLGLFDNDEKGIAEFNGNLPPAKFDLFGGSSRIKKHKECNIFGMKLPIPPSKSKYFQKEQKYNMFSIEHYFSDEFLLEHDMLTQSPISGLYKINPKRKTEFSKLIRKLEDKNVFIDFVYLFKEIDMIFNVPHIEYDI